MAKKQYKQIGAIFKSKEAGKPDYVKIGDKDVLLKAGSYLNLESKASRIAGIEAAVAAKKMSTETAESLKASANKMPDFIRFNLVQVVEE